MCQKGFLELQKLTIPPLHVAVQMLLLRGRMRTDTARLALLHHWNGNWEEIRCRSRFWSGRRGETSGKMAEPSTSWPGRLQMSHEWARTHIKRCRVWEWREAEGLSARQMEERYVPFACSLLAGLEVVGEHCSVRVQLTPGINQISEGCCHPP